MARPIKNGLEYFSIDVDFFSDLKIRRIKKDCGPISISILICLLCNIYRDGYYIGWNEDMCFAVAETTGAAEGAVSEVVHKALSVGLFDKSMFVRYKILTSNGIQKRYENVAKSSRIKKPEIDQAYRARINVQEPIVNVQEPGVNVAGIQENRQESSINVPGSTQSKVKESKEKDLLSDPPAASLDEERDSFSKHKKKPTYDRDSRYYKAAAWLARAIEGRTPGYKPVSESALQAWANEARLIIETDKRDVDTTNKLLAFSQGDPFWQTNILSMGKFRKQYDQLLVKYQAGGRAAEKKPSAECYAGYQDLRDLK